MKTGRMLTIILVLLLLAIGIGLIILARAPMMPPVHKVEQVIPDDHIPH